MDQTAQFKQTLARVFHFSDLPDEIQNQITSSATLRHFDAGQILYVEGEPAQTIYILQSGWVKATRMTRAGREQAMMFLQPGEVFGDIAAFAGTSYPGTAAALETVKVWTIPAQVILDLIPRYPELARAIVHHLANRVLYYVNLVEDLSLRSVEARLANNLLKNAELKNGQLIVTRREWATYDEMAVRLGTVRDVLSRTLKTLEAENLLRVEKQAIILLDPKGLANRADR